MLRIVVSLSILMYLYFAIRGDQVRMFETLTQITFVDISIAFAILVFTVVLQIWRWHIVTKALSGIIAGNNLINIFMGATFSGLVLPSSMGGDAIRMAALLKSGVMAKVAVASVFLDRISGLMALLLMVVCAHSVFYFLGSRAPILVSGLLISLLLWIFVFTALRCFRFEPFASNWRMGRIFFSFLRDFKTIVFSVHPGVITFLLSLSIQILSSVCIYFIARSLQVEITLWACVFLVPIVMLATAIPISIAGWGVREGAMVLAFAVQSVPADRALLTSLVFGVLMTLIGLTCGFLWLCSPRWDAIWSFGNTRQNKWH